jgi:hypothetical protein
MRATTELVGPARRFPSTRSAACRVLSDGGLLPGCFQLATSSWLTSPLVLYSGNVFRLPTHGAGRRTKTDGIGNYSFEVRLRGSCSSRRRSTAFHMRGSSNLLGFQQVVTGYCRQPRRLPRGRLRGSSQVRPSGGNMLSFLSL